MRYPPRSSTYDWRHHQGAGHVWWRHGPVQMASAPVSSSMFMRLVSTWRLLALRSDVDSIILELLGVFSLEKIYSEGDKETYQQLLVTLLAQLNSIFYIQRLSLPSENLQVGWYLGFIVRSVLRKWNTVEVFPLSGVGRWDICFKYPKHLILGLCCSS